MKKFTRLTQALGSIGLALLIGLGVSAALNRSAQATPSIYVVDETNDDVNATGCTLDPNDCSLRGAILNANLHAGSTILVPTGTYVLTDSVNGRLGIFTDTILIGAGAKNTIIQGKSGWATQIIYVGAGTVRLNEVTLRNGNADNGGAVYNLATLSISNSVIVSNSALSAGGVFNTGNLWLTHTQIISNISQYGAGGLYNGGVLTVNNSLFANNRVWETSTYHAGGALESEATSVLRLYDTAFMTNSVYGDGGALALYSQNPVSVTLQRLIFISNTATWGGAIFCSACRSTLSDSLLDNNEANMGGAVYASAANFTIDHSRITHNHGANGGGLNNFLGVLTVTNSLIAFNDASSQGAGVYNDYTGTLLISGTMVSTNTAWSNGGGLLNQRKGWAVVINSQFISNAVTSDSYNGGAIDNYGLLQVSDSRLISNTAGGGAGAFGNSGVATITRSSLIGNVTLHGAGGAIFNYDPAVLTIDRSTFSGNLSPEGSGGGIINESYLKLTNSTLSGNYAHGNGGGLWHWSVYPSETAVLNAVTIVSNSVDNSYVGGGLYVYPASVLSASNILIADNARLAGTPTDCSGQFISLGYNLIQTTTGCIITSTLTGVISNTDPLIGPLQDNGGSTWTHALLFGSPAIDHGDPANCLPIDQRGAIRPIGAGCDIGAYEAPRWSFLPIVLK